MVAQLFEFWQKMWLGMKDIPNVLFNEYEILGIHATLFDFILGSAIPVIIAFIIIKFIVPLI